jgi:hypothetical protein
MPHDIALALGDAEIYAQARHFLSLQSTGDEKLETDESEISMSLVENYQRTRLVQETSKDVLTEGKHVSIYPHNRYLSKTFYVSIFSVEVNGCISHVLNCTKFPSLGYERIGDEHNEGGGLPLLWPDDEFPRD